MRYFISVDIEGIEGRDFEGVERRGKAMGEAVLDVCRNIQVQAEPVIGISQHTFLLPYREVPEATQDWAHQVVSQATGEAVTLRDGISDEIKADNILWLAGQTEPGVDFEMVGIRLGQAVFFTVPGELFTEIGKQMKELSKSLQIHVIGLANGYHGYISTAKASAEGGYATNADSGAYFTEGAEGLFCQSTEILLDNLG